MPAAYETSPPAALPARRRRAVALPPDERRSTIIDAASPLIMAHGEKVTTLEIAVAAGVAEGTVFRVFPTKDELIEAVVERVLDQGPAEKAFQALDPGGDLEATVAAAVTIFQKRIVEVWQLITSVGPRFHPHGPTRHESPALAAALGRFAGQLAVDPRDAATMLRAATFAMTHPLLVDHPLPPCEVAARFLYGVVRKGC